MSSYCGRHSRYHEGTFCPRCEAEERAQKRHHELLEGFEETARAMRDSDYRHANPGDYECPHCKYLSLKSDASRCPLCRGDIGTDYWNKAHAARRVAAERRRAEGEAEAAEQKRAATARAAAAATAEAAAKSNALRAFPFIACSCITLVIGVLEAIPAVFEWICYGIDHLSGRDVTMEWVAWNRPIPGGFPFNIQGGIPVAFASPLFLVAAGIFAWIGSWIENKKRS